MVATPGQGPDRPQEVSYTDTKVIGNGSFGVVYQAKLCDSGELVAIKKVLQDKRFKVRQSPLDAAPADSSADALGATLAVAGRERVSGALKSRRYASVTHQDCRCEAGEPAEQLLAFSQSRLHATVVAPGVLGLAEVLIGGPQWDPKLKRWVQQQIDPLYERKKI